MLFHLFSFPSQRFLCDSVWFYLLKHVLPRLLVNYSAPIYSSQVWDIFVHIRDTSESGGFPAFPQIGPMFPGPCLRRQKAPACPPSRPSRSDHRDFCASAFHPRLRSTHC